MTRIEDWVQLGNRTITVSGIVSSASTPVQRSYPLSTVTVYATGTTNLVSIYSDNVGTSKANPFTADATGYYFFYIADGDYDIKISGDGLPGATTFGAVPAIDPYYVGPDPNSVPRLKQAKMSDVYSVKDLGAVGDGTTDDTQALQNAITYGISHRVLITIPAGVYRTTDTLHIYGSASIHGGAGVGEGISIIRYEGTGTAIEIRNGNLNPDTFCFACELRDLTVQAKVGFHPQYGIAMYTLSEGNMDHVTVGGDATQGRFQVGWYMYKANIIEMPRVISSYNDVAFDFTGTFSAPPSIISITNTSSVFDADIGFRFNGCGISIIIENSFIESTNTVIQYDSSAISGGVTGVNNIVFRGNHVLLNRPGGDDHKLLYVLCGASINLVRGIWIENNYVLLPNTFVGANCFVFDGSAALFNTGIFVTVNRNFINGFANELSTSNTGVLFATFRDNFAVKGDGFTHNINHTGSGIYLDSYINDIGNNNFTAQSATLDIVDKVAVTSVLIHEGGAQGSSSTLRGVDTGGNTKWFFNKGGDLFSEGALALTNAVSNRWEIVKNGAESSGNAGSNFQIFRYSDAGGFLSSPFFISRATSRFGFNFTAPVAGMHYLNPDASVPALFVDMASGQATDAMQIRTASGVKQWGVDSTGNMTIGNTTTLQNTLLIASGAGTPEGAVTAPVGSIYMRTNGGAGTSFYVKETGTGNTGWVGK